MFTNRRDRALGKKRAIGCLVREGRSLFGQKRADRSSGERVAIAFIGV